MPPENRSVHSVSKEMGVGEITIHRWISQIKDGTLNLEQDEENPSGQRNMTEKLNLLLEYQKIPQEEKTAGLGKILLSSMKLWNICFLKNKWLPILDTNEQFLADH